MASRELQQWVRANRPREDAEDALTREERLALHRLRMEAKAAGTVLSSAGRGGLSPSLVLHVFRRDHYKCKVCGGNGVGKGGVQIHHKGNLENPVSKWLEGKGRSNDPNNLVTICKACHDNVHDDDRAREEQSHE